MNINIIKAMNHKLKSLLLLLVVAISAKAQIENGKVYNFVNVENNGQSMAIASNNDVTITETNTADYTQLWYVLQNSDFSYSLRNLGSGRYLRSSNATSEKWTMVKELDNNCKFRCVRAGEGYTLRATNTYADYHYMHYGANEGRVVCWSTDAKATQWTMNEVGISSAELNNNWNVLSGIDPSDEVIASYQTHLDNLFNDKACTVLKKSFDSESALKGNADYLALPVTLQDMVLKVYQNNWTEDNYDNSKTSWGSDYAKKYRVQLYEPYNEPEAAASALGLNAHTNLNNPTGIFANKYQSLYIMVEGSIKDGASLYLASYTGNGKPDSYNDGVELTEGLNIIPSFVEGNNYCINYVVHTFDTSKGKGSKAKAYRLSEFDDLKIHIEGGYINGYWNKMGDNLYTPDTNSDWDYIEERATQTTVTVLGEYITLQFPLHAKDAVDNDGRPNEGLSYYLNQVGVEDVIDEWDNVMLWERLLLGVLDGETVDKEAKKSPYADKERVIDYTGDDAEFATGYGDYYNVHGLSFGVGVNYMYGGWDHCGYHYNTMQSIIVDILTNAGSHWGPGHEIGHQHQNLLNLNGLTEVTNNLFSNVVLWYFGETTSRYNGVDGALSNVLAAYNTEGSDFYTNNIWAQTHMYYKLFLYYHVLGHNPKFYPRLFEMLRQDPMINGAHIDGATSLLHFYKKCCYASGDDLTEFFRAHGFFRVMTDRLVEDYSDGTYNMSQKDINEAIAEVKEWAAENNAKENISVLFINDATGGTIKSHKGDNLELYGETRVCAEVGSYASFNNNTTPNYTYAITGNEITMEGNGGIGFAIFNDKGEILAFSDKKKFTISKECEAAIISGKAEVAAVKADNSLVNIFDIMSSGNAEIKHAALGELITSVQPILALIDNDGTKPGFYAPSAIASLQTAYDEALVAYNNREESSYVKVYDALRLEHFNMETLGVGRTAIIPNSTYVLTNKGIVGKSMALNASNYAIAGATTNTSDVTQQWIFEFVTGGEEAYYIKTATSNVGAGGYLGSLVRGEQIEATATKEQAKGYKAIYIGNGAWALQCQDDKLQSLNYNKGQNKVLGWDYADDNNSHWYLIATNIDEASKVLQSMYDVLKKTKSLIDEMADVQYKDGISIIDGIDVKYVNFIDEVQLKTICDQVIIAQQKYNLGAVTTNDVNALQEQYDILLAAYTNANDAGFNALKTKLTDLISNTNSLINTCGSVTFVPNDLTTELQLQTTDPNGDNYLSSNAPEPNGGHVIENLLDYGNANNHFHSAWSWDVNEVHHLKVDLGSGKSLNEFTFTYRTAARPWPYEIKVYGSTDNVEYAYLGTFSKDDAENRLPITDAGADDYKVLWTSSIISSDVAYRYLRFDVTSSGGKWSNATPYGEYCFTMSYFGVTAKNQSGEYVVELSPEAGNATQEQLLQVYHAVRDAQMVLERANTENQLQKAYEELQALYKVLAKAMNIELNVIYTVSIVGGNGEGGVWYGEKLYLNSDTIVVESNIDESLLSPSELEGYNHGEITVNHDDVTIQLQYTLDKTELAGLIATVNALVESCYTNGTFNYVSSLYVTDALMTDARNAVGVAQEQYNNEISKDEYHMALESLRDTYTTLQYAIECAWIPVLLTADMQAPVLYTIKTKREGSPVLQYEETTKMLSVTSHVAGEATQAFFFVKGQGEQVYIYPYMAGGEVLGANDVSDGHSKAKAMVKGTANYEQWTFVKRDNGYYNLKPVSTSTYLSHYGGGDNKMGFYSASPDSDLGSLFLLERANIEGSYAYHKLKSYCGFGVKVKNANIQGSTAPGYYPEDQAQAYNLAYSTAKEVLASVAGDDETYRNAYEALAEANESLEINMPEAGKCYVFRSVTKNALAYASPTDNKIRWSTDKNSDDAVAVWTITPSATEGFFNICNLGTGTYMNRFANQVPSPLSETAGDIEIVSLSGDGQVGIKCDGTMMHVQYDGAVVHWNTGANEGSAWRIEEVSNATGIENEVMENDAIIYDLYGRRIIDVVASGLYIVNGKKCYITK